MNPMKSEFYLKMKISEVIVILEKYKNNFGNLDFELLITGWEDGNHNWEIFEHQFMYIPEHNPDALYLSDI